MLRPLPIAADVVKPSLQPSPLTWQSHFNSMEWDDFTDDGEPIIIRGAVPIRSIVSLLFCFIELNCRSSHVTEAVRILEAVAEFRSSLAGEVVIRYR